MIILESDASTTGTYKGIWACKMLKNESVSFISPVPAVITNVTLGVEIDNERGRTTLGLCLEERVKDQTDEERDSNIENFVALCSLLPGRVENFSCQIPLSAGKSYIFRVIGHNSMNLVGYFDPDEYEYEGVPEDEEEHKTVESGNAESLDDVEPRAPIGQKRSRLDESSSSKSGAWTRENAGQSPTSKRAKHEAASSIGPTVSTNSNLKRARGPVYMAL